MQTRIATRPAPTSSSKQKMDIFMTAVVILLSTGLIAGLLLTAIMRMREGANQIDQQRAMDAALAASHSFQQSLAATVRDNAEWDDAFEAIKSDDALKWIGENWGEVSADYPLYDGVIVTAPDGDVTVAYLKGKIVDARSLIGGALDLQLSQAKVSGREPAMNYISIDGQIALIGSLNIQPYTPSNDYKAYSQLSFFKFLSGNVIAQTASEHQLPGLHLTPLPPEDLSSIPLNGPDGAPLAFLSWPRADPGNTIYYEIRPNLLASAILFLLFLIFIVFKGSRETSRLRATAEDAHERATRDSLTGLLNRSGLIEVLASASMPSTLHLIDLDGFKGVNDAWGHAVGDELLKMVARRLHTCHPDVRHAARFGGDEFAILQSGVVASADFGASIVSVLAQPFEIGDRVIEIGGSIGYAPASDTVSPLELMRRADMALYRAKEDGRGRTRGYTESLDTERAQLTTLEHQLRDAIVREKINPMFQPLVSATTSEICGVEALARWETETGPVSPEIFIPLAERSGLIDALGMHILVASVKAIKEFPKIGLSVNVSPVQLCNPEFAGRVISALDLEFFDPGRLTLEITEGVLISNPDQAKRAISALKAHGVKFALDDFGCGFASIGALRQFGFDRMKIDRSLVWAVNDVDRGAAILDATIALATALKIPVTAEGIETAEQAQILRSAGCDQLQGYLVGKPVWIEELMARLDSTNLGSVRDAG